MSSLIRATALWGYGELVQELGEDPERLRQRFRIPPGVENQQDAFIPIDAYARMLEASAEDLRCPDFGLRLSRWQGLDILGPIAVIARNAQTVLAGLEMIGRYLYVHSPALTLAPAPRTAERNLTFSYEVTEPALTVVDPGYEMSMAIVVRILGLLGGPGARPSAISFMHDQKGSDGPTEKHWDARCALGRRGADSRYRRAWPADGSRAPIRRRSVLRRNTLRPTIFRPPFRCRNAWLSRWKIVPTGQCSVDAIANQLAMHPRSLQRRLAKEGVRCHDLIERERRALAERYLAEPGLHLCQVAGLLGYAEQSTLNLACRRWFGKTPRQYRAGLRDLRNPVRLIQSAVRHRGTAAPL